jgi:GNAT superfamily N-acetyltransferase
MYEAANRKLVHQRHSAKGTFAGAAPPHIMRSGADAMTVIRRCGADDVPEMFSIINDAAQAYNGVIPADCWHEPYMPLQQIRQEIRDGVAFWGYESGATLVGVMGIQDRGEVDLIRHAYVQTAQRGKGIGEMLLKHLEGMSEKPILIGTWSAATWAIRFYEKNGYRVLSRPDTEHLLRKYWSISDRQIETSVVLANAGWRRHG